MGEAASAASPQCPRDASLEAPIAAAKPGHVIVQEQCRRWDLGRRGQVTADWVGQPLAADDIRMFYGAVRVTRRHSVTAEDVTVTIAVGDPVEVHSGGKGKAPFVGLVEALWEDVEACQMRMKSSWFYRDVDVADVDRKLLPRGANALHGQELFYSDICDENGVEKLLCKATLVKGEEGSGLPPPLPAHHYLVRRAFDPLERTFPELPASLVARMKSVADVEFEFVDSSAPLHEPSLPGRSPAATGRNALGKRRRRQSPKEGTLHIELLPVVDVEGGAVTVSTSSAGGGKRQVRARRDIPRIDSSSGSLPPRKWTPNPRIGEEFQAVLLPEVANCGGSSGGGGSSSDEGGSSSGSRSELRLPDTERLSAAAVPAPDHMWSPKLLDAATVAQYLADACAAERLLPDTPVVVTIEQRHRPVAAENVVGQQRYQMLERLWRWAIVKEELPAGTAAAASGEDGRAVVPCGEAEGDGGARGGGGCSSNGGSDGSGSCISEARVVLTLPAPLYDADSGGVICTVVVPRSMVTGRVTEEAALSVLMANNGDANAALAALAAGAPEGLCCPPGERWATDQVAALLAVLEAASATDVAGSVPGKSRGQVLAFVNRFEPAYGDGGSDEDAVNGAPGSLLRALGWRRKCIAAYSSRRSLAARSTEKEKEEQGKELLFLQQHAGLVAPQAVPDACLPSGRSAKRRGTRAARASGSGNFSSRTSSGSSGSSGCAEEEEEESHAQCMAFVNRLYAELPPGLWGQVQRGLQHVNWRLLEEDSFVQRMSSLLEGYPALLSDFAGFLSPQQQELLLLQQKKKPEGSAESSDVGSGGSGIDIGSSGGGGSGNGSGAEAREPEDTPEPATATTSAPALLSKPLPLPSRTLPQEPPAAAPLQLQLAVTLPKPLLPLPPPSSLLPLQVPPNKVTDSSQEEEEEGEEDGDWEMQV